MKTLTVICLRLFGIFLILQAVEILSYSYYTGELYAYISRMIYPAFEILTALLLWIKSEKVSEFILKDIEIEGETTPSIMITDQSIVAAATFLIGLYIFVSNTRNFFSVLQYVTENQGGSFNFISVAGFAVEILVALFLMVRSQNIAALFSRLRRAGTSTDT